MATVSDARPGFAARLALALTSFFRLLFDPAFAARLLQLDATPPALPAKDDGPAPTADVPKAPKVAEPKVAEPKVAEPDPTGALTMLALFQREGRLVDFLEQDVASFSDADIGAAARLVHDGCRKALRAHATVAPLRTEAEESRITVDEGYDPAAVKLTGKVGAKPPYRGVLRHAGWRVTGLTLPRPLAGHDAEIVAPAEVEL